MDFQNIYIMPWNQVRQTCLFYFLFDEFEKKKCFKMRLPGRSSLKLECYSDFAILNALFLLSTGTISK